jgi:hypothetical protein
MFNVQLTFMKVLRATVLRNLWTWQFISVTHYVEHGALQRVGGLNV